MPGDAWSSSRHGSWSANRLPHPFLNELKVKETVDAETLCDASGQWRLADRSATLQLDQSTAAPLGAGLAQPSDTPLRRLSYTQMNSLRLVRSSGLSMTTSACACRRTNIPTGNQIYGTLASVVEELLKESNDWLPEAAAKRARRCLTSVLKMAAELLRTGRVQRGRIRNTCAEQSGVYSRRSNRKISLLLARNTNARRPSMIGFWQN